MEKRGQSPITRRARNCIGNGGNWTLTPFLKAIAAQPGGELAIDLSAQAITLPGGSVERFEIDSFRKDCLLNGWDDIDLTLKHESAIAAYESRQRSEMPWLT